MVHGKYRDSHSRIRVDGTSVDLIRIHATTGRGSSFHSIYAIGDVQFPSFQNVLGHGLDAFRAVDLERRLSAHDPGSQDQVWISCCMVRMQMGQKNGLQDVDDGTESHHSLLIV